LAQLHLIVGVLALALVVGTGWMFLSDKPFTQPAAAVQVVAPVTAPAKPDEGADVRVIRLPPAERASLQDSAKPEAAPGGAPPPQTITIIDGTSGRRQEIQIPAAADDSAERTAELAPEQSRPVPMPRAAAERTRPSDANGRRAKSTSARPDTP
jgi:hypothetical protein